MPIDDVSAKQEQLKRAAAGGSLSNEAAFRDSIAKFQGAYQENKPLIIDISTSAELQFKADLVNLAALQKETRDFELARLIEVVRRSLAFLARTKEDS